MIWASWQRVAGASSSRVKPIERAGVSVCTNLFLSRLANASSKQSRKQTGECQDDISSVRLERLESITMVLVCLGRHNDHHIGTSGGGGEK